MENDQKAMEPIAAILARWVANLRYEDLSADVIKMAKQLILDQLGVQLLGSTLAHVKPVKQLVESMYAVPESTITLGNTRTGAPMAAYVNGAFGHSCEYDDAHALAWHTSSAVVPATLALAEREKASGESVIVAVVCGVQVMSLLGSVTGGGMVRSGWHGSKVLGVFGAAAAAGKILNLTEDELINAFGIGGSDAGGTMEYDQTGGEVKRLHAGSASRSGVEAALLAKGGFTGPSTIFEGKRGIFPLFGRTDDMQAFHKAWAHWHILDTIFRFYPNVATIHSPLDAVRHLREHHNIDWHEIQEIKIGLVDFAMGHGAEITRQTDAISAQFSLAFSVGLQFKTGKNAPQDYFKSTYWSDPDVLAIGDLIKPWAMPIPEGDPAFSSHVEIIMRDGSRCERYQRGFRGHPLTPATLQDIKDKFQTNVASLVSAATADAIIGQINDLENISEIARLTDFLKKG